MSFMKMKSLEEDMAKLTTLAGSGLVDQSLDSLPSVGANGGDLFPVQQLLTEDGRQRLQAKVAGEEAASMEVEPTFVKMTTVRWLAAKLSAEDASLVGGPGVAEDGGKMTTGASGPFRGGGGCNDPQATNDDGVGALHGDAQLDDVRSSDDDSD